MKPTHRMLVFLCLVPFCLPPTSAAGGGPTDSDLIVSPGEAATVAPVGLDDLQGHLQGMREKIEGFIASQGQGLPESVSAVLRELSLDLQRAQSAFGGGLLGLANAIRHDVSAIRERIEAIFARNKSNITYAQDGRLVLRDIRKLLLDFLGALDLAIERLSGAMGEGCSKLDGQVLSLLEKTWEALERAGSQKTDAQSRNVGYIDSTFYDAFERMTATVGVRVSSFLKQAKSDLRKAR